MIRQLLRTLRNILLLALSTSPVFAEIPLSLSFHGVYGSPVQPDSFSAMAQHAFGFNGQLDFNATPFLSIGAGFQQISFLDLPNSDLSTAQLELRLFPFDNERQKFSPYLYGGGGLNLSEGADSNGPYLLKAGLGTRVSLAGPLFADLSVGSQWFVDPGAFQIVDARLGLSYSFAFQEGGPSEGSPSQSHATFKKAEPAAEASSTGEGTTEEEEAKPVGEKPNELGVEMVQMRGAPTPTPTEEVVEEEEGKAVDTENTEMMKNYRIACKAYLSQDYEGAIKYFKKCLASDDPDVQDKYYAEAHALLGVSYHVKRKDDDLAREHLEKALDYNPKNPAALKYKRILGPAD